MSKQEERQGAVSSVLTERKNYYSPTWPGRRVLRSEAIVNSDENFTLSRLVYSFSKVISTITVP